MFYEQNEPWVKHDQSSSWDAVTYSWTEPLLEMLSTLDYIWLDIININQNSKDIVQELKILPTIYRHPLHKIVNIGTAIQRGWCCYEIAIHNAADSNKKSFLAFSRDIFPSLKNVVYENKPVEDMKQVLCITHCYNFVP